VKSIKFLQLVSFLSRITAMFVGIFQSLLIVNILSTSEFGLIGLVASIAGVVGIAQHLGLASSSTKEISAAKNDNEIFHIALTSISIRYLISLPISLVLLVFAPYISDYYNNSDLTSPLRIFALVLLVQALQSIFNSIIQGKQQFKKLFSYQVYISFISVFIFIPFVYFKGVIGYFYALLIFNIVQTLILGLISIGSLKFKFSLPTKAEYKLMFYDLLKVSMAIYLVKIIFTAWQEIPVLILGQKYSLEMIGIFAFAFNFASKLMAISDSITDVNLPVFSKKVLDGAQEFFAEFNENFNFLYSTIFIIGTSIIFWSKEILKVSDYFIYVVIQILGLNLTKNIFDKYEPAVYLFFPLVMSIIFYSYLNIFKSSIYVPLTRLGKMINSYLIMVVFSFGMFYLLVDILKVSGDGLLLMSWSLAFGSLFGFLYTFFDILINLKSQVVSSRNIVLSLFSVIVCMFTFFSLDLIVKLIYFAIYFLVITFVFKINFINILMKKVRK